MSKIIIKTYIRSATVIALDFENDLIVLSKEYF